jgi:cathepsin F
LLLSASANSFLSAQELEAEELFTQFMKTYHKSYTTEEETAAKFATFKSNLKVIAELSIANPSAQFGITKFSDVSPSEFAKTHLTY